MAADLVRAALSHLESAPDEIAAEKLVDDLLGAGFVSAGRDVAIELVRGEFATRPAISAGGQLSKQPTETLEGSGRQPGTPAN